MRHGEVLRIPRAIRPKAHRFWNAGQLMLLGAGLYVVIAGLSALADEAVAPIIQWIALIGGGGLFLVGLVKNLYRPVEILHIRLV